MSGAARRLAVAAPALAAAALALAAASCNRVAGVVHPDLGVGDAFVEPIYDLACVGSTIKSGLKAVDLVILLDRSGSMGDGVNGDPTLKWQPITHALETFLADPKSAGMSAVLTFFPVPITDQCNPSAYYADPSQFRALPDLSFQQLIDATTPAGSTPTLPAVEGAISTAQDRLAMVSTHRAAIVLVTDGDPDECDSSVNDVAQKLAQVASTVPTFVVGVGSSLQSLNQLAAAGGTGQATFVSVGDPTQTATDFQNALKAIRGLVLPCSFPVPSPPPGMTIDFTQVNLTFVPFMQPPQILTYDKDCASGAGWRYDDPNNPTQVELCPTTCDAARADENNEIDVLFGCTTIGNLVM